MTCAYSPPLRLSYYRPVRAAATRRGAHRIALPSACRYTRQGELKNHERSPPPRRRARPRARAPALRPRAARKSAGVAARREGPRRSQGARRADRHLRDEGRPAQRRPNRRARVGKSRLQEAPARGRHRRDRGVRLHRPPRRGHGSARKHAQGAQRRRVHAVLLLSVAGARAATRLVQVGAVSRAHRDRSARRSEGVGERSAGGRRGAGVGFDCRASLPRAARASGGNGRLERGRARGDRHARRDDRRGAGEGARAEQAMNGVHDMGGMHGMGPVEIEKKEPVFHSDWEARVHALNLACSSHRKWNIDMGRHSRERIPPAEYLAATYYEKWLRGLEMLLLENGLVTAKELETGRAESKASGTSVLRAP